MKAMIQTYETTRTGLMQRIGELNTALRDPMLRNQERERLEQRREILRCECIDVMHILADLRRHGDKEEKAFGRN